MFQVLHDINIDWMGNRRWFIGVSVLLMLVGMGSAVIRQATGRQAFNLGVDFQGGTVVTAKFRQKPATDDIRGALQTAGINDAIIQDSTDKQDEVLIKVPNLGARPDICPNVDEAGRCFVKAALDTFGKEAEGSNQLTDDQTAAYKIVGTDAVGPVAGAQLRNQAVIATLLGLVGILLFIAFRYDWTYAAGAVIAVFHDVLITLAFFSVFQWEISLTVLAALLTLVGFSVNDSIVIFDRVRENLVVNRTDSLFKITNDSINQTLSRTIITAGLVLLSVLALVLFGGEVLKSFSLALLVGVTLGTYSTIAIASPIAIWWQHRLGEAEIKDVLAPQQAGEKLASSSRRTVTRRPVTR